MEDKVKLTWEEPEYVRYGDMNKLTEHKEYGEGDGVLITPNGESVPIHTVH